MKLAVTQLFLALQLATLYSKEQILCPFSVSEEVSNTDASWAAAPSRGETKPTAELVAKLVQR